MLADDYEAVAVGRLQDIDNPLVHDVGHSGAIFGGFPFEQIDTCKRHDSLLVECRFGLEGCPLTPSSLALYHLEFASQSTMDNRITCPGRISTFSVGHRIAVSKYRILSNTCLILSRTLAHMNLIERHRSRDLQELGRSVLQYTEGAAGRDTFPTPIAGSSVLRSDH